MAPRAAVDAGGGSTLNGAGAAGEPVFELGEWLVEDASLSSPVKATPTATSSNGIMDRAATLVDYSAAMDLDGVDGLGVGLGANGQLLLGTTTSNGVRKHKSRTAQTSHSGQPTEVVSSPETLADLETGTGRSGSTASPSSRTFSDSEDSNGSTAAHGSGSRRNTGSGSLLPIQQQQPQTVFAMPAAGGPSTVPTFDFSVAPTTLFASVAPGPPLPVLGAGPAPSSPRKIKNPRRSTTNGTSSSSSSLSGSGIPSPRPLTPLNSLSQHNNIQGIPGLVAEAHREPALNALKAQLDASRGVGPLARSIQVLGVPLVGAKSRVETQIKICLQLLSSSSAGNSSGTAAQPTSSTDWSLLRIPEHMLASRDRQKRSRTQGNEMDADGAGTLDLQAEVICASEPGRTVSVCGTCMQRERKRVRKRTSELKPDPMDNLNLDTNSLLSADDSDARRILLFNINSLVDFSGDVILPSRITCYCRHHSEKTGFCIYFTMRDHLGRTIATGLSPPILITDDHKSLSKSRTRKRPRTSIMSYSMEDEGGSIYEQREDEGGVEVKAEPMDDSFAVDPIQMQSFAGPVLVPVLPAEPVRKAKPVATPPQQQTIHVTPQGFRTVVDSNAFDGGRLGDAVISKVVPGEGPLHGGVDVTVLGTGFHNGLTVLFGSTPATATQYWNSNTLVVILPPGTTPGPVVVSFKDQQGIVNTDRPLPIFVYKDDSERQLMELALQVVGLRINGRIEDARDIALRIIGESAGGSEGSTGVNPGSISPATLNLARVFAQLAGTPFLEKEELEDLLIDIFEKARHKAKYLLTVNQRGLSLLHLAVLADMPRLTSWLSDEVGAMLVDAADDRVGGWTALMWASWLGRMECAEVLLNAGADGHLCDESGRSAWELAGERGWDDISALLEVHGYDESEYEDESSSGLDEEGEWYEDDEGWESEGGSYLSDYETETEQESSEEEEEEDVVGEVVHTTTVLPIIAVGGAADVQPAPPGEIPALPIPLPLASTNAPGSPTLPRPPSVPRNLDALAEEATSTSGATLGDEPVVGEAMPMDPAGPLRPEIERTARWFNSLTSLGSAVQNIDVGDVARYPFTNMPNPFRHFELPSAIKGLLTRRKVAVATAAGDASKQDDKLLDAAGKHLGEQGTTQGAQGGQPGTDSEKTLAAQAPTVGPTLSVFSWVGQSSSSMKSSRRGQTGAQTDDKAAPADLRQGEEEAVAPSEAFTAVVDDQQAVQGYDYTNLLWFWLPMAVLLASLATLRYLSYTEDIERIFLEYVDQYLLRLVWGTVQQTAPIVQQGHEAAAAALLPEMMMAGGGAGPGVGHEFAVQPPLVAAVG